MVIYLRLLVPRDVSTLNNKQPNSKILSHSRDIYTNALPRTEIGDNNIMTKAIIIMAQGTIMSLSDMMSAIDDMN